MHEVWICTNEETLTKSYFLNVGSDLFDEAAEIIKAGKAVLDDDPRGVVVGLKLKAHSNAERASAIESGFAVTHGGQS